MSENHKAEAVAWLLFALILLPLAYAGVRYLLAGGWFQVGIPSLAAGAFIGVLVCFGYCLFATHQRWHDKEVAYP